MKIPVVLAAPHRLAFLVGSCNLGLLSAWWLMHLAGLHLATPVPPAMPLPATLLHAPVFLYLIFPPFVFGFLLTVFPRWMGYPDLGPRAFGPVAGALAAGAVLVHLGLWSATAGLISGGLCLVALGWTFAIAVLAHVAWRSAQDGKPRCWHAWSALAALATGLAGLALATAFTITLDAHLWSAGNSLGIYGFLLPVFLTISHRMVPFFAANVVADYVRWRPEWLLAAIWAALLARLVGDLLANAALVIAGSCAMAALTALMAFKWWPRGEAPGLLKVLIWGFAWAPVSFALATVAAAGVDLGRAPGHALLIGFSCSMLVAMVTRVTQGHSGGPLMMPQVAWMAFGGVQLAAVSRLSAALAGEDWRWLIGAVLLLLGGTLPWLTRNGRIYVTPRSDGRPG